MISDFTLIFIILGHGGFIVYELRFHLFKVRSGRKEKQKQTELDCAFPTDSIYRVLLAGNAKGLKYQSKINSE